MTGNFWFWNFLPEKFSCENFLLSGKNLIKIFKKFFLLSNFFSKVFKILKFFSVFGKFLKKIFAKKIFLRADENIKTLNRALFQEIWHKQVFWFSHFSGRKSP